MALVKLYNLARMTVSGTPGTGTITLLAAATSFITFANAGVSNGELVRYAIEDGNNREEGYGTYTSSGTTLSRTVVHSSTNGGAKISATSAAVVGISPASLDFAWHVDSGGNSISAGDATNPIMQLDFSGAATGIKITGAAAGSGIAIAAISSGTDESMTIDGKGAGDVILQSLVSGNVGLGNTPLQVGGVYDKLGIIGSAAGRAGLALMMFSASGGIAGNIDFYRSRGVIGAATVVSNGDMLGRINSYGAQQTGTFLTQTLATQIRFEVDGVVTSGATGDMPGRIVLATTADGDVFPTDRVIIDSAGAMKPGANDGTALGTSSLMWSDLFLASGAVLNFNAGNYTLTHSSGALTASGNFFLAAGGGAVFGVGTTNITAPASIYGSGTAITVGAGDGASSNQTLTVAGPTPGLSTGVGVISVFSNDTVAADKGGSIAFGGKYNGNDVAGWARIFAGKDNSTSGNFAGYLSFLTRPNGGNPTEGLRISSAQIVTIPGTTPSTTPSNGSLINAGGFGNAGAIFSGDQVNAVTGSSSKYAAGFFGSLVPNGSSSNFPFASVLGSVQQGTYGVTASGAPGNGFNVKVRASVAGLGTFPNAAGYIVAGIYGWVPTGGHGSGAVAGLFERPDQNTQFIIHGAYVETQNIRALQLYNTSTPGVIFELYQTGEMYINNTTVSNAPNVGALVVAGGVGVGGAVSVSAVCSTKDFATVANGGNSPTLPSVFGLTLITDTSAGEPALYLNQGGTQYLIGGGPDWVAPTTTPAGGKSSLCWDGSTGIRIYNNRGVSLTFRIFQIQMN